MKKNQKIKRDSRRKVWNKFKILREYGYSIIFPSNYKKIRIYQKRKKKNSISKHKNRNTSKNILKINLGENIDFNNGIDNLYNITKQIDNYIKSTNNSIILDHSNISNVSIAGMLYLIGQISKIYGRDGARKINLKYSKKYGLNKNNEKNKYLFYKSGYWKYFGIDNKPYKMDTIISKQYFLSIQSDIKANMQSLNKIKKFAQKYLQLGNNARLEYKFDDIIKEAMGNSIEHAYPKDYAQGREQGKWWICAHYYNNILEIILYDYGVGLRESMKRNLGEEVDINWKDNLSDKFKKDSEIISIAINGDLSKYKSYKESDRGKGFKRFKEFVVSIDYSCELTVFSGKGKYNIKYDTITNKEKVILEDSRHTLNGTLIKWKINTKKVII